MKQRILILSTQTRLAQYCAEHILRERNGDVQFFTADPHMDTFPQVDCILVYASGSADIQKLGQFCEEKFPSVFRFLVISQPRTSALARVSFRYFSEVWFQGEEASLCNQLGFDASVKEIAVGYGKKHDFPLTCREREILGLIARGHSNKEIAWCLGITEGTLAAHRRNLYQKTGLHSTTQLAIYALTHVQVRTPQTLPHEGRG